MKKFLLILTFVLQYNYFCDAQVREKTQTLEAVRVAFITKELNLTPSEAQQFWPVYNNYTAEIKSARKGNTEDEIGAEETIIAIKKKYQPEFKKIFQSDSRVNQVFTVEPRWRNFLRSELLKRQQLRKQNKNQE